MSKYNKLEEGLKIIQKLNTGNCFIVGGYVRNLVIGRNSEDIDLAVEEITSAKQFADRVNGNYYLLGKGNLHRVEKEGFKWDFIKLEGEIKQDLKRRDFSCDSLALEIKNVFSPDFRKKIIDPFNGIRDLDLEVLRPTSSRIFIYDPIRILRAYRLKQELRFRFADNLLNMMKRAVNNLERTKGEQIGSELEKLLGLKDYALVLIEMARLDIFNYIYPFSRSLERIKEIINRLKEFDTLDVDRFVLMLSVLWEDEGIGERLRISNSRSKLLKEFLNGDKDIFETWFRWKEVSEDIFKARYVINGDKDFLHILRKNKQRIKNTNGLPLISGNDILEILRINPSPQVGMLLKELRKAQFNGEIKNTVEAVNYLKENR